MKTFKQTFWILILLSIVVLATNVEADCKIAKSYIVTLSGGGYSMAGKVVLDDTTFPSNKVIQPYVTINGAFIGSLAYTAKVSEIRSSSVNEDVQLSFTEECNTKLIIPLNKSVNSINFTAYSDNTINLNGVIIGDVIMESINGSKPAKVIGITGNIRISEK